jgi:tryptophan halogenase
MNIVIVGGGTAGWVCAYLLKFTDKNHNITVVDSSKIGILGVGESTTGLFTDMVMGNYGIDFYEFVKECDATPKMGVLLKDWSNHKKVYCSPIDGSITKDFFVDTSFYYAIDQNESVNNCNAYAFLMENNKVNIDKNNPNQKHFGLGALHIDTFKTNQFFRKKCKEIGVNHIDAIVEDLTLTSQGFINKLILSENKEIYGDFFIDASGFRRKLISAVGSNFVSFKKYLPVNQAISFVVDKDPNEEYSAVTTAQAMNYGWMWKIPTRDRYGMGYVYSSDYTDKENALKEVNKFLGKSITPDKVINFESGRLDKFWNKNCLAIGVAGSFLEPLQATSIHTTMLQIFEFTKYLKNTFDKTYSKVSEKMYNNTMSKKVDNFRDFVSCHYAGGKTNTDFWKNIILTETVQDIIELAKHRLLYRFDLNNSEGFAGYELWSYTLEGNGIFSHQKTREMFEDNPNYFSQGEEYYNNFYQTLKNTNNTLFSSKEFDNYIRQLTATM